MNAILEQSELLAGLDKSHVSRLLSLSSSQPLDTGEYLFQLGDDATRLYVVLEGRIDICFPFSLGGEMRDIAVESKSPGSAIGWSSFVKPNRFRLSARAAQPSTLASFERQDLQRLIDEDSRLGLAFISRIAEIVGGRLLKIQALWARELQRSLPRGMSGPLAGAPGAHQVGPDR